MDLSYEQLLLFWLSIISKNCMKENSFTSCELFPLKKIESSDAVRRKFICTLNHKMTKQGTCGPTQPNKK